MIDLTGEEDFPQAPTASTMVEVTNRNGFIMRDRFNGVPYEFKPNETITLSPVEANHFFGYPAEPKLMAIYMAKRFGWTGEEYRKPANPRANSMDPDNMQLWQFYASQVAIKPVEMVMVRKDQLGNLLADDGAEDELETLPISPHKDRGEPLNASKVGQRKGSAAKGRRRPARRKTGSETVPPIAVAE